MANPGRPVSNTPKKRPMTVTIDEESKDRLRCYAYRHRMNLSQAVTYLIWEIPDEEVDMSVLDKLNEENYE